MRRDRHAKIVATVGPASRRPDVLRQLSDSGVDVFRLNFSHGSHQDHAEVYAAIRALEAESGRPIGILQDLQGPKIRIGTVRDGEIIIPRGTNVRFVPDGSGGGSEAIPLPHAEVFSTIAVGHRLLLDDGRLLLHVTGCGDDFIDAYVEVGGPLSNRKGVNLPDTPLEVSPLTDKDRVDLAFGLELGVDWVALSFVQRPADILEARDLIGDRAGLMAKIEKPSALTRIDEIVALSDAVMVARGDLGVEIAPQDVPALQKELVRACRLTGKPVVIATQMLDSMVQSPAPTRAEASDVATAIYDGADAVMLSAESAIGNYPVEAVTMMDRIIAHTESHRTYRSIITALQPELEPTAPHALSAAAGNVAGAISAACIVAFSSSGTTTKRIARGRPEVPILGITPSTKIARQLALLWGTHSVHSTDVGSYDEMVERAKDHAVAEGFAGPRDKIVIIAGIPFGESGSTNNLRVATI